MTERCLLLFTKPATPGRVKTRLIGELTPRQAADLHAAFLGDLRERLAGGDFHLRLAWALDDDDPLPVTGDEAVRQEGTDLGMRLLTALHTAARDHRWVAAVGSDHPDLTLEVVEQAFQELESGARVVLGPARDGGYYLVGVASDAIRREFFSAMPWSTSEVLRTTVERCRAEGVEPTLLPLAADVDTPEDLRDLVHRLSSGGPACPRTRQLLHAWGRLG